MTDDQAEITEEERSVFAGWELGSVVSVSLPATGTINRTLIIQSTGGPLVLRISSREKERIEWEHECIRTAALHSLPVCCPVPLPSGETIIESGSRFFALFPTASGEQISRMALDVDHAWAAGNCLARIHAAFQDFPSERARIKSLNPNIRDRLASIPLIEAAINALSHRDYIDELALEHLAQRRRWLEQLEPMAEDIQERLAVLPQIVVHGDYQETNLFFLKGQVSAVIDWDQSGLTARGWEILRALNLMLALRPKLCRAFLSGYHSVLPLLEDELQEAAACYGILADSSLWIYSATAPGTQRPGEKVYRGKPVHPIPGAVADSRHRITSPTIDRRSRSRSSYPGSYRL